MIVRLGTRGSDLALAQSRLVAAALRAVVATITCELVTIRTHGDEHPDQPLGPGFPADGFVGAVERALLDGRVDLAVHSTKDLPTTPTPGLAVVAHPARGPAHDVIVSATPLSLDALPAGLTVGTSSPRRAAQLRRIGPVEIVSVRGNVPTRVAKVSSGELDAVVVAAAGLERLGLDVPARIDLDPRRVVPAAGQGSLAVQIRADDADVHTIAHALDDPATSRAVVAERAFLAAVGAGCHTPVGAYAVVDGSIVALRAELFSDAGAHRAMGDERGSDSAAIGETLADRLRADLQRLTCASG